MGSVKRLKGKSHWAHRARTPAGTQAAGEPPIPPAESAQFHSIGHHVQTLPWRLGAHEHPGHEMIVVMRGSQCVKLAGREITACEGDVLFYPAAVAHAEWTPPGAPLETYFIGFAWNECPAAMPLNVHDAEGRIRVLAGWLYAEKLRDSAASAAAKHALMRALLAEYVRLWQHVPGGLVEDLRRHVMANIAAPLSLDSLAAHLQMSKYHLVRRYKALARRTPMEDVRFLRMEHARDLVLSTSLPLKEIALKAGLGNVYHMSRLFTRHIGMPPGALRRTR
jgi:AraC-like DNA-binding protein